MPDNVTSIYAEAFAECANLTAITFGNNVDSIGKQAFRGCSKLENIELPDKLSHITDSTFQNCTGLKNITIPDGVLSIGVRAFDNCSELKDVSIGKNVISIGERAFRNCQKLTDILIPDNVTTVGSGAFSYCRNLTNVTIGEKVTHIGNGVFSYIWTLEVINSRNPVPPISLPLIESLPHMSFPALFVPAGSGDAYRAASGWKDLYIEEREDVANETINKEDFVISNTGNGISVSSSKPVKIAIYTMSGQIIYQHSLTEDLQNINLERGIYIVKVNNIAKKVYVR